MKMFLFSDEVGHSLEAICQNTLKILRNGIASLKITCPDNEWYSILEFIYV